jgi:hypothetical protein
MKRLWIFGVAFALLAAACTSSSEDTTTTSSLPPTTATTSTTAPATTSTAPLPTTTTTATQPPVDAELARRPAVLDPFAAFAELPLLTTGQYAGPDQPASLAGVLVPASIILEPETAATLARQGFVIVPAKWGLPEFFNAYQSFGYEDDVFFVTTDVAYHYLHLAFSKVLRESEEQVLLPRREPKSQSWPEPIWPSRRAG